MSKERFEVFGNIIKDNEDIPALLNNYQVTVRLNELNDKVKELEQELAELKEKAIVPKFSSGQIVYFANIVEGTVNKFNYIGEDKYNYVVEDKTGEVFIRMKERTFATEQEAQDKLKEMSGNE